MHRKAWGLGPVDDHISKRATEEQPLTTGAFLSREGDSQGANWRPRSARFFDAMVEVLHARDKKGGPSKANKAARSRLTALWTTAEGRRSIAPGKALLAHLSDRSKTNFGVQFGPEQIARSLRTEEIDGEVVKVIDAIVAGRAIKV
jgi:hypothetical protein